MCNGGPYDDWDWACHGSVKAHYDAVGLHIRHFNEHELVLRSELFLHDDDDDDDDDELDLQYLPKAANYRSREGKKHGACFFTDQLMLINHEQRKRKENYDQKEAFITWIWVQFIR
ncbi:unnamed protein product [Musa acuminata subsp. malaccensis]|uniref:(wild Malaysian banana) hypothetical protein n=1 Tax=Musa acuminata subsp. malaccensis TaxID=214687 RepID=A0A804KDU7_MUSAM|nr:unnamed protein product [Musa acuminata subsp. malaccensis]